MRATLMLLGLTLGSVLPAAALTLHLPVRRPGAAVTIRAPAYAGDVLEVRLAPAAARVAAARAGVVREGGDSRVVALGVISVDQLAARLGGIWFSPEFRGETPPLPGSDEPDFTAFYVAHLPAGVTLEDALESFRALGDVASADPLAILRADLIPNDSLFASSHWLYRPATRQDIHAPEAWNVTTGDTAIVVAVLDSGVLPYHPDLGGLTAGLSGQIWTNWAEAGGRPGVDDDGNGYIDDIHGWDFVTGITDLTAGEDGADEDNDPNDFAGHGTVVAGAIGAIADNGIGMTGVAWKVRIMPLRMGFAYAGAGPEQAEVRMDFAASAIRYATRMGASVINCSWESDNTGGIVTAVTAAVRAGVTIVNSSGNDPSQPHYLSDRDDVISVAASDSNDVVTSFSNLGPFVDLAAPGVNLASTALIHAGADSLSLRRPTYAMGFTGTSMSAPLVSGVAALIQAQRRTQPGRWPLTPRGVQLRLMETADDIAAQNPSLIGRYGAGRLNAARAVTETDRSIAVRTASRSVGPSVVIPSQSGRSRVAWVTLNGKLVILDPVTQDTIAIQTLGGTPTGGLAAANLGTTIGLFVATFNSVAGFDADGSPLPGWPQTGLPIMSSGPVLADIEGDGLPEIICGGNDAEVWAWHVDGSPVTGFPVAVGTLPIETPVAADRLGFPDSLTAKAGIVVATGGMLHVIQGDGTERPGWPQPIPGGAERAPVVLRAASFEPLVVAVAGRSLHLFDRFGVERPGFPVTLAGNAVQDPALADLNRDGIDEIVVATNAPATIEVRDTTGASLTAQNWPRPLSSTVLGPPIIGGPLGTLMMVMRVGGLLALSSMADSLPMFPKPGGAGTSPTITNNLRCTLDVVAGTGSDSLFYVYRAAPCFPFGTGSPPPPSWATPRGNFGRSGTHFGLHELTLVLDDVPPRAISDLRTGTITDTTVRLLWTTPSDVGTPVPVSQYEVRRATFPLSDANFSSGTLVPGAPIPAAPSMPESLLVGGLGEGTSWYFAIRSRDRWGNWSTISNVVHASTTSLAPAAVTDLRETAVTDSSVWLAWTATGDDGMVGRPRLYAVRAAGKPIDDTSFVHAPEQRIVSATVDAGGREVLVFRGLAPATRYWFALKAVDAAGNVSRLSNVLSAQTDVGGPLSGRHGVALAVLQQPSRGSAQLYWQSAPDGEGSRQSIHIYDLTGRRLRVIELGSGVGGRTTWDGRDAEGRRVPAGLYYARLLSGSVHTQTRLVLLP